MCIDDFRAYQNRISQHISKFPDMTEGANKTVLIMSFLMLLGYDVFDPTKDIISNDPLALDYKTTSEV